MEVTEQERHQLLRWFEEHMGQERAATMMKVIQPVGWSEVATKRDLEAMEARVDARFAMLEASLTKSFVSWMLTSQAVMVAVVGLLVGLR